MFRRDYEVTQTEFPGNGTVGYEFGASGFEHHALVFAVSPATSASSWTGRFATKAPLVNRAVTDFFGTPDPDVLCVLNCGAVLLVNVHHPQEGRVVALPEPITSVLEAVDARALVLASPWTVTVVRTQKEIWTSHRIAIEDIGLVGVDGDWLRGIADPADEEAREFSLNLSTRVIVGGVELD